MTNPYPPTVYIKWIKSTNNPEDDFLLASEHPTDGASIYELRPTTRKENDKMIEPSNMELSELPETSRQYISDLEQRLAAKDTRIETLKQHFLKVAFANHAARASILTSDHFGDEFDTCTATFCKEARELFKVSK